MSDGTCPCSRSCARSHLDVGCDEAAVIGTQVGAAAVQELVVVLLLLFETLVRRQPVLVYQACAQGHQSTLRRQQKRGGQMLSVLVRNAASRTTPGFVVSPFRCSAAQQFDSFPLVSALVIAPPAGSQLHVTCHFLLFSGLPGTYCVR